MWPAGGVYSPGYAEWAFQAPGTTRIARAELTLGYPDRLLSHHCFGAVLRAGVTNRSSARYCQPATDTPDPASFPVQVVDPAAAPVATEAAIRLELPCSKSNVAACDKNIPAAPPEKNGLHVDRIDMTLADDDTPTVTARGPLHDLAGRYINGSEAYDVTADTADAGAGISQAGIDHFGHGAIASADAPCDPTHNTAELASRVCPAQFSQTFSVDSRNLPEGKQSFAATSADYAGNRGASEQWDVFVDRTAPGTPTEMEASLESDEDDGDITFLDWNPADDPPLPDGSPGSGTAEDHYRYRSANGDWSDWKVRAEGGDVATTGFAVGDTVTIETYTVDVAGNASPVATDTVTVEPSTNTSGDWELGVDNPDDPPAVTSRIVGLMRVNSLADIAEVTSSGKKNKCAVTGREPKLTDRNDEPNTNVYAWGSVGCPVGSAGVGQFQYMRIWVSIKKNKGGDSSKYYLQTDPEQAERHSPQPPITAKVNMLCKAGTYKHLTHIHIHIGLFGARDIRDSYDLKQDDALNCNEAGAWRVQATEDISSPSGVLGTNLDRAGDEKPRKGFEAHHMIPAKETGGSELNGDRAQAIGYGCGIGPNSASNGVWLLGPDLKPGSDGWDGLPSSLKKRQYHRTLHTKDHFDWLANKLDNALTRDDDYNPWACDHGEALSLLRQIKGIEEDGDAPY